MRRIVRRVTLRDVSLRAGVSIGTASRVLNGSGGLPEIGELTRRRVLSAASRLGYRADLSARAVRTGRFGAVMFLQDADSSRTLETVECLDAACACAEGHDLHVVFARIPDERLQEARAPKVFRQAMVDGLVLNYHGLVPRRLMRRVEALGLPWVLVNNRRDRDCVYPDELAAGREAAERLLRLGHRRIAYLDLSYVERDAPRYHFSRRDRLAGYRAAMSAAGLEPVLVALPGAGRSGSRAEALGCVRSVLERRDRPTAFIANDGTGELLRVAETELGMQVPRDLSVVSFEATDPTAARTVSAMVVPWAEMGSEAVEMLVAKFSRPARPLPPRVLHVAFREGDTCGRPGGRER